MLSLVMEKGRRIDKAKSLQELQAKVKENLNTLHTTYKRFINPHVYKVSLSEELSEMKMDLIKKLKLQ